MTLASLSSNRLDDRVAIVTGGAAGIGRATSLRLAREGASVLIADIRQDGAAQTAAMIEAAGGFAMAVSCDVADEDNVKQAVGRCIERYGRLDILANVAGITARPKASIENVTLEQFTSIIAVNLVGTFLFMKHSVPFMKSRGYGRIVNVASIAAFQAVNAGNTPYGASKGGVIALTKQAVSDLSRYNITVNAVAPGVTRTEITDQYDPEVLKQVIRAIPVGRIGEPEDIAAVITFFASDDASFLTGQLLVADGGMTSIVHHG